MHITWEWRLYSSPVECIAQPKLAMPASPGIEPLLLRNTAALLRGCFQAYTVEVIY